MSSDEAAQVTVREEAAGPAAAEQVRQHRRIPPVTVAIMLTTALALALRLYQVSRPGGLFGVLEYDDGVYFGDAVRLVHGSMPYADFSAVHPPGIMLLMAPLALISRAVGTADGLALARIATALISAANVALIGVVVRHRGVLAVACAGGFAAVYLSDLRTAQTLLLEPWLTFFCIAGVAVAFAGDGLASRRRLLWAGVLFGFAGTVKIWAVVPVVVLLVYCLVKRRHAGRFAAGVAAGFLVPVAPFLAAAPRTFVKSVVIAQLTRVDTGRVPTWLRLKSMAGLSDFRHIRPGTVELVFGVGAVLLAAGWLVVWTARRRVTGLEVFAAVCTVLVVAMFLYPPDFYFHYSAFLTPFLSVTIGLTAAGIASLLPATAPMSAGVIRAATAAVVVLALLVGVADVRAKSVKPLLAHPHGIPAGACVVSDSASLLIATDRFVSSDPRCPKMVDSVGTDYALSSHNAASGASRYPSVRRFWMRTFERAQFIWLSSLNRKRIAWTPQLRRYFARHFARVPGSGRLRIYERTRP